jgi:HSP20 family protein
MALTTWKPMSDLFDIHNEMSRVFDDFFGRTPRRGSGGEWVPAVDISETPEEIFLRAEIPGASEKDVNVSVTDNVLTLKGEKRQESAAKGENYHRVERTYGAFQRSFSLPRNLKTENTTATFKNGVLTVCIPKAEEVKPKEIRVSVD